jgi:hypothetical protein
MIEENIEKQDFKSILMNIDEYEEIFFQIKHDDVTMYHHPAWLKIIENGFGVSVKILAIATHKETVLSLTPLFIDKFFFVSLVGSPLRGTFTEFLGPIFYLKEYSDEVVDRLFECQHKALLSIAHYVEIGSRRKPNISMLKKLSSFGYQQRTRQSVELDLQQGKDEIWANFKGRLRTSIRKAKKKNVEIFVETPTLDWIESFYQMLSSTYMRQNKLTPHPKSFYQELPSLVPLDMILCISAKLSEKYVANAIFLIDSNRIFYLSGTSNDLGMRVDAMSLIQWNLIKLGLEMDAHTYDMGGIGIPSIDKFKMGFGGKKVVYDRWVYRSYILSLLESLALRAYSIVGKIKSFYAR